MNSRVEPSAALSEICRQISDSDFDSPRSTDKPECRDDSRQGGGLLFPSRVVQEEAGERWTPIFEHADQCSTLEVFGDAILRDPREARSLKRSLNHEINIIEEERAMDGDRERLVALVELPFVDTLAAVRKRMH